MAQIFFSKNIKYIAEIYRYVEVRKRENIKNIANVVQNK